MKHLRLTKALLFIYLLFIVSTTCASEQPIKIMPLGDSITAGYTDNPNWQHPLNFGCRNGLLQRLRQTGIKFVMVGQSAEPFD